MDPDSTEEKPVFNRIVSLKDSWAKIEKALSEKESKKQKSDKGTRKMETDSKSKDDMISIDDFAKLDLRVAEIVEAELVEGADKLIKLQVDLGEDRHRQIFAGIRTSYPDPKVLIGKQVIVVANLKPRKMRFGVSEGMILASGTGDKEIFMLSVDKGATPGQRIH